MVEPAEKRVWHPGLTWPWLNQRQSQSAPWAICAILVGLSASLFLLSSRYGIGVRPDTFRYMGLGWKPDDAPVYGWLLRGIAETGLNIWGGAKLLGLVLSCLNPILIWVTLMRATRSNVHAAGGTILILLSPSFSRLSALALSEALFITCIFTSVLLFVAYLKDMNWRRLAACGAMIAVTTLVRFPGMVLGFAIAATLLLMRQLPLRQRVRSVVMLGSVGGGITLLWAIVSKIVADHAVGRDFAFYGNADVERWKQGFKSLTALLAPMEVPLLARAALLLAVLGAVAWIWFHYCRFVLRKADANMGEAERAPERTIAPVFGFFALFYAAFMVLAVHLEANLPLNGRYALPLYVTLVTAATIVVSDRKNMSRGDRALASLLVAISIGILASHTVRTASRTEAAYEQGLDFASRAWASSPTIHAVRRLPRGAMIFSNGPEAIIYAAKRPATIVPMKMDSRTGLDRPHNPYPRQLEATRQRLQGGNAYVVFVDRVDWRFYTATENELRQALGLKLVERLADGRIYNLPPSSPSNNPL
ncbi:glycosyltransferase family 39 protein [Sphingobium bisphenolivorans]|uniref:glycosyltransferase family 39 protein n=1 Tax=Sphingobium bisphenolivorans TaxID=1335760 RepID=UPI0003B539B4|nr:glycosyltransferase family 39 protein [Sphingobium bisphenolivorans]